MKVIRLEDAPSQEFGILDHRLRLNYNYLANRWSASIFDNDGVLIRAGDFFDVGDNLLKPVGKTLVLRDFAPCPSGDWYFRLTNAYLDGFAESGLVLE